MHIATCDHKYIFQAQCRFRSGLARDSNTVDNLPVTAGGSFVQELFFFRNLCMNLLVSFRSILHKILIFVI